MFLGRVDGNGGLLLLRIVLHPEAGRSTFTSASCEGIEMKHVTDVCASCSAVKLSKVRQFMMGISAMKVRYALEVRGDARHIHIPLRS